jgi:hypothetical protein
MFVVAFSYYSSGQAGPANRCRPRRRSAPRWVSELVNDNSFVVRVVAFPATRRPKRKDSETMFAKLLAHLIHSFRL